MTSRRGFVEIHGSTPAAGACAAVLAGAGVPLVLFDANAVSHGHALVSAELLNELQIAGEIDHSAIESVTDRRLSEDDALDTKAVNSGDVVVERSDLVAALMKRGKDCVNALKRVDGQSAVSIDARDISLGSSSLLSDDGVQLDRWLQVVQVAWQSGSARPSSWIRLSGDPLLETNAMASVLTWSQAVSLTIAVPMASLVATSITLPDVIARLLAHPAVRAELPDAKPVIAVPKLLTMAPIGPTSASPDRWLRVGPSAGMADAVHLDRELKSAIVATEIIAAGLSDGRMSLRSLSRISREWKRHGLIAVRPN
jgi:flavin-dependent dehydrogenase